MESNFIREPRESKHIRIKRTIFREARRAAFDSELTLAQWLEDAITEKLVKNQHKNTVRKNN